MIDLLINNGADIKSKNKYGISVMHIAAQGDQPLSLYYFKELGISI
eukprot:CAMPEP_0170560390 /NCGR_PEP_ID=MMETSP0211-20121228/48676_1 /TAXON_ID=311385 /ORGANISM="Pseudokeronopsis sp., Strain OXSARD2" /LENGTH=45 /DNA_ID= /DNA_START= /DNA_END= /DNA_ORIENTATION=